MQSTKSITNLLTLIFFNKTLSMRFAFLLILFGLIAGHLGAIDYTSDRAAEANEIANTFCRIISVATGEIGKSIFGFILIVTGIATLNGKFSPGVLIGLTLGIIVFFSAPHILGLLIPNSKLKDGCKCKTTSIKSRYIDANGNEIILQQDLKIDENCNSI